MYAHTGVGALAPATRGVPYLLYVPQSAGTGVTVIDPTSLRVVGHYTTGLDPQHVVPAYDLKTLYSTNDLANSLTPFDPRTGRPAGPNIAVDDPYNMYFTPGGAEAVVVAEARQQLEFYDAHSFVPHTVVHVDCAGLDHADFTADGRFMLVSCEFAHRLVRIDLATHSVAGYVDLPGSSPQDVRISADGRVFYVADMYRGGVHLIDTATFTEQGFLPTGRDAHGLYPTGTAPGCSSATAGREPSASWTSRPAGSSRPGGCPAGGARTWVGSARTARFCGCPGGTTPPSTRSPPPTGGCWVRCTYRASRTGCVSGPSLAGSPSGTPATCDEYWSCWDSPRSTGKPPALH